MEYVVTRSTDTDELMHYGVKGMKWGVRRARPQTAVDSARANYKSAKKEYNKSFNKAYNRAVAAYSPVKKHRQANAKRWEDAANKAEKLREAKTEFKNTKKANKKPMSTKKKVAIGAAVAGGVLAAYGANKIIRNANANIRGHQAVEEILKNYVNPTINRNIQAGNIGYNSETARNFANKATAIARRDGINSAANDSFGTAVKNVYNEVKKYRK